MDRDLTAGLVVGALLAAAVPDLPSTLEMVASGHKRAGLAVLCWGVLILAVVVLMIDGSRNAVRA